MRRRKLQGSVLSACLVGLIFCVVFQDLVDGYQCTCTPGWTGDRCRMEINECGPSPCENNATCYVSSSVCCPISH